MKGKATIKTLLIALLLLLPTAATAAPYVITGSGTSFTATIDGENVTEAVGKPIQDVIDAIKTDANGSPCEIQFGGGTVLNTVLNIDTSYINFNGNGVGWDATITGRIASSSTHTGGAIYLVNGANVDSKADIIKTNTDGYAIRNNGTGTLTISGGAISATRYAVYNGSTGTVNITGGTIAATNNYAVYNASTGTMNISGGNISATRSVYNGSTGIVNITGGTISATTGAVYNASTGTVNISGGTISATDGTILATNYAVYNASTGTVNISGGTISATSTSANAVRNFNAGKITISGGTLTTASTSATNGTVYIASSGTATEARLEITGGTITNTIGGNAVYNASSGSVSLGGSPAIKGKIYKTATAGNLSVITEGENAFAPAGKTYTLDFATYTVNAVAVTNGSDFFDNFTLVNDAYALAINNDNIVIGNVLYHHTTNGTTHTINKTGSTTASVTIQTIIDAIKTDANGSPCEIQFGDGITVLNIGTASINFDGDWNATITGKITSSSTSTNGAIYLTNGANVDSKADIRKTNTDGYAIRNNGTGTLTISGGAISATRYAVRNDLTGTMNISGGTISATTGYAVYNGSTGPVNISGGTITATTDIAVYENSNAGKITISGGTLTSANTSATSGTVYIASSGLAMAAVRLEITGGTITNTAANGNAVYNASTVSVSLGGSPAINGKIYKTTTAGNLRVITEGENAFAPEQTYTLDFATYTAGTIAAVGGKDYLGNFKVANSNYRLIASGSNSNLVIATATEISCLADGKVWEDDACRAKTDAELKTECEATEGKVWEDGECKSVPTPIRRPQLASGNIRAYAANKSIVLENLPKDAKVEVYSLQGKRIYSANSENSQILKILIQTKGVYIAKIGTQIFRVAVK